MNLMIKVQMGGFGDTVLIIEKWVKHNRVAFSLETPKMLDLERPSIQNIWSKQQRLSFIEKVKKWFWGYQKFQKMSKT